MVRDTAEILAEEERFAKLSKNADEADKLSEMVSPWPLAYVLARCLFGQPVEVRRPSCRPVKLIGLVSLPSCSEENRRLLDENKTLKADLEASNKTKDFLLSAYDGLDKQKLAKEKRVRYVCLQWKSPMPLLLTCQASASLASPLGSHEIESLRAELEKTRTELMVSEKTKEILLIELEQHKKEKVAKEKPVRCVFGRWLLPTLPLLTLRPWICLQREGRAA